MRFRDKIAIVSGAGSGIGREVSEALGREGAGVVLLGRTASKLEETAARLPPGKALCVVARHERPEEAARAVRSCLETFGRLDVLVNNAGAYTPGNIAETGIDAWEAALSGNLTGPYVLTRESLPELRKTRGAIVNVSSSLAIQPVAGAMSYCVAKAGLNMLTRTTALEEASAGVRVNAVCPGVVDTPIHRQRIGDRPEELERFLQEMAALHPIGRVGVPEEVAALVLFLSSSDAAWLTGAVIPLDGGISLT